MRGGARPQEKRQGVLQTEPWALAVPTTAQSPEDGCGAAGSGKGQRCRTLHWEPNSQTMVMILALESSCWAPLSKTSK